MKRILIIEDDAPMAIGLQYNLEAGGYEISHCADGESGLKEALGGGHDLIVLDMMLPGLTGTEVLLRLRETDVRTPVLILSAMSAPEGIIQALNDGADDYLTKPFDLNMLLARIHSLIRSRDWLMGQEEGGEKVEAAVHADGDDILRFGDNEIDFRRLKARTARGVFDLSYKEAMMLKRLASHPGEVVSRDQFLREVWGYTASIQTRTIDNFVMALRKKVEPDPRKPRYIQTIPGVGYRFVGE